MKRIPVSKHHGWRLPSARALRDAIFLFNKSDYKAFEEYAALIGRSIEDMLSNCPEFVFQYIRRYIPPPSELHKRVSQVFEFFGSKKDKKTGLPLFGRDSWRESPLILGHIARGCDSDDPLFVSLFILLLGFIGAPAFAFGNAREVRTPVKVFTKSCYHYCQLVTAPRPS